MQYTSNNYLLLYQNLNHPQPSKSKLANQQLLQLQSSQYAFNIAAQLMSSKQNSNHIHGLQLLSKKLNNPLPYNKSANQILAYLIKYPKKSDLLYCCIAKIFIHLGITQLPQQMKQYLSSFNQPYHIFLLRTFKEMPSIVSIIITQSVNQNKNKPISLKNQLFQKCKPLIIQNFQNNKELVLGCLQSYILMHGKINSPQILDLLLHQDLQTSSPLLQQILINQKFPSMNQKIWNYLISQQSKSQTQTFFPTYLSFCSSLIEDILIMSDSTLFFKILSKILNIMRTDAQNVNQINHHYVSDTFQFWFKLIHEFKKIKKQQISQKNKIILCEAVNQIWSIVITASKRKQLAQKPTKIQNLVIDLQDQQSSSLDLNSNNLQYLIPDDGNRFRLTAQDFFTVCFDFILDLDKQSMKKMIKIFYSKINDYSLSNDQLDLELAIYVMQSITQIPMVIQLQDNQLYQGEILKIIMNRKQLLNLQLCQKLINLMGKLQKVISNNLQILCSVLQFIKKAFTFQQLASVAAQNFCQILISFHYQQTQKKNISTQLQKYLEGFLNQIYSHIYGKTKDIIVLQQLTKSLLAFIFKFKDQSQSYKSFLINFHIIIQNENNSIKQKCRYIQCLLSSSHWAMIQGIIKNKDFLLILSQFITSNQNMLILLRNCQQAKSKTELAAAVRILTLSIKIIGPFNVKIWLQLTAQLINKMLNSQNQTYGNVLNPLIALIDIEQVSNDTQDIKIIIDFFQNYQTKISQFLIGSETVNYNLSKSCLKMHQIIIKRYIRAYQKYNPQKITIYISQRILKNNQITQFQILRQAFGYYILLAKNNYGLQLILQSSLLSHKRTGDALWRNLETILFEIYHKQRQTIFLKVFSRVKPQILPPNPLWKILMDGLERNDSKSVKNILLCLS